MSKKILFVIKKRNTSYGISFGLLNSAQKCIKAIIDLGYEAKLVQVFDNSNIDREVYLYKPDIVIIEALWVVPSKMKELSGLYPNIKWVVRVHSKTPFLANEGIAFSWLKQYTEISKANRNLFVAANNFDFNNDLSKVLGKDSVYLPNIYQDVHTEKENTFSGIIKIGCFGSIRPLKNHVEQAVAAMIFANQIGKRLEFHVNAGLLEQRGEEVLKNLRGIFENNKNGHKLVEQAWMSHEAFIELVKSMDIGMQVSLSESFNIVSADFVSNNIPMVVSTDISWMPFYSRCIPTSTKQIVKALHTAWKFPILTKVNNWFLKRYNKKAINAWKNNLSLLLTKKF